MVQDFWCKFSGIRNLHQKLANLNAAIDCIRNLQVYRDDIFRLVVLESGLGLESGIKSIFAGLGLGKICNQVQFQFSLCIFAVFCLGRMTIGQAVSYTRSKISVTYLIFTYY